MCWGMVIGSLSPARALKLVWLEGLEPKAVGEGRGSSWKGYWTLEHKLCSAMSPRGQRVALSWGKAFVHPLPSHGLPHHSCAPRISWVCYQEVALLMWMVLLGWAPSTALGVVARPFQGPGGQMPPGGATGEEHPLGELCKEGFVALGSKIRNSALVIEIAAVLQFKPVLPRIWCVMREGAEGWGVVGYLGSSQKPT